MRSRITRWLSSSSKIFRAILLGLVTIALVVPGDQVAGATSGTWTTKAPMPTARTGLAAGVVNGILYAVGGQSFASSCNFLCNTVEAYDPVSNTWTTKAPMPTARVNLAVGVVNGILYAVGGFNNATGPLSTVEAYDPASNTWTTKAPMSTARWAPAAGVVNGVLYAVGGQGTGTVEAYDPLSNTWTMKAPMSISRGFLAAGVVNGILYAVGGQGPPSIPSTVEAYDPVSNTWTTKPPMPTGRAGLAAGVVNGILYAVGGDNPGVGSTVEAYDPVSNTWTTKAPMPTGRGFLAAVGVNSVLYAVGGENTQTGLRLATNEAFTEPVPFAAFSAKVGINLASSSFDVTSTFTLGSGGSINPLTDAVTFQVGSFSITIPPASFQKNKQGSFVFQGTINRVALQIQLSPQSGGAYAFKLDAAGSSNLPTSNPVTVGLTIGNNTGSTAVNADFQ